YLKDMEGVGDKLENKLLEIIRTEKIEIRKKQELSYTNNATIHIDFDSYRNMVSKTIFIPAKTNVDNIDKAITIAHELGHYFGYKNVSRMKLAVLHKNNKLSIYMNEKLAWKEAEKIIQQLGFWLNEHIRSAFEEARTESLSSYSPYNSWFTYIFQIITNPLMVIVKLWIFAFILLAFLIILVSNGISVPFLPADNFEEHVSNEEFFSIVATLHLFFMLAYFLGYLIKRYFNIGK